jgi:hypothetical protein
MKKNNVLYVFLLLLLALQWRHQTAHAQNVATWSTLPDLAGNSAAQQIATQGVAYWVQVTAPTTNVSNARCGDSSVSATRGSIIAPGAGQMVAPVGYTYNMASIYCYVATNDKVSLSYVH